MAARAKRIPIPIGEIRFQYARSSGAGGQNVNKVATKAVLRWPVAETRALSAAVRDRFLARHRRRITRDGELVLTSQRFRDRGRNVADCLEKLHALLDEVAEPPKRRRPTRPSGASRERRLAGKRRRAELKRGRRRPGTDE
jgi:ribosome-associated protein